MFGTGKIVVAVPVKNEELHIGAHLAAMAAQTQPCDSLLFLLNNSNDKTFEICKTTSFNLNIVIIERTLRGDLACAGEARRLALAHAQALAGDGVILTTDADAAPPPDWIEKNLAAMRRGAEMVCGQACLVSDEGRLLPRGLHFDEMREGFLLSLLDEIDALVDPDPADPWPRHQQRSGASIALRAATLKRAGGAPHVASGEDRALVEQFRAIDARIRHEPDILVPVSGRLEGRASAGMAATLKRRVEARDALTDERLEPAMESYRRSLTKARLRTAWQHGVGAAGLAADVLLSGATLREALQARYFGAAWVLVQRASPVLQRRRVTFASLAGETRRALQLRDMLCKGTAAPLSVTGAQHDVR